MIVSALLSNGTYAVGRVTCCPNEQIFKEEHLIGTAPLHLEVDNRDGSKSTSWIRHDSIDILTWPLPEEVHRVQVEMEQARWDANVEGFREYQRSQAEHPGLRSLPPQGEGGYV
jgi:hypothetical protein